MQLFDNLFSSFSITKFKRTFKITWLYVGIGLIIFFLFMILSDMVPRRSFFSFFIQNIGIFTAFTFLLMAYAGVYRVLTYPDDALKVTRQSIKSTFKRTHYLIGISFLIILILSVTVMLEVGVSTISLIPYAGPVLISLLTIPIFLLNFFIIIFAITMFAVLPPIVGEARGSVTHKSIKEIITLIKSNWITITIYILISLSILFLSIILIYFIIQYTTGITKSIQWKINAAYPKIINQFTMRSYLSDIVYRITPRPDSMAAFKKYGFEIFNYLNILRYIISISYIFLFSLIISFPLSVYFNFSSIFFRKLWKHEK